MKKIALGTALVVLALGFGGCRRVPHTFVPVMQTAAEQYAFALNTKEGRAPELIGDEKKYRETREIILQTFAKVPENFPDDRKFTPLAKLDIINMRCGFDSERAQLTGRAQKRVMKQSIEDLAELAQEYPEMEFIQAKTLYDRGMCHKALGEFEKMQECFKAVRDKWLTDPNTHIKEIAAKANYFYQQTYVQR